MTERDLKAAIRLALGRSNNVRLFNNPAGAGWGGNATNLRDGSVLIKLPRRIVYGLAPGSADLIGWSCVTITPGMVGQSLAVFTSCEVKTPKGRPTPEQINWRDVVAAAGGRAGVVRSVDEAIELVGAARQIPAEGGASMTPRAHQHPRLADAAFEAPTSAAHGPATGGIGADAKPVTHP